jgi:hypothetical protein
MRSRRQRRQLLRGMKHIAHGLPPTCHLCQCQADTRIDRRPGRCGSTADLFVRIQVQDGSVMSWGVIEMRTPGDDRVAIFWQLQIFKASTTCSYVLYVRSHSHDNSFMHSDVSLFYTYTVVVAELYFVIVTVSLVSLFMP